MGSMKNKEIKPRLYIRISMKQILERFVFFPDTQLISTPESIQYSYEDIYLSSPSHEKYHGWYIENSNQTKTNPLRHYILLFCHGNAGNISHRIPLLKKFLDIGFSICIFDYPSFGLSEGTPNEESCILSTSLFYQYLLETKKYQSSHIILYGESIGGSIATSVANKYSTPFLILQSTFTDIKQIIQQKISIPSFLYTIIGFETYKNLKIRAKSNISLKTCIIHSQDDDLIPFEHAKRLAKYADLLLECKGKHSRTILHTSIFHTLMEFILSN